MKTKKISKKTMKKFAKSFDLAAFAMKPLKKEDEFLLNVLMVVSGGKR